MGGREGSKVRGEGVRNNTNEVEGREGGREGGGVHLVGSTSRIWVGVHEKDDRLFIATPATAGLMQGQVATL